MSDRAPIELPGQDRIQPCGFLLGLTEEWIALDASANAGAFLDRGAEELVGQPASDHVCVEAIHSLRNRLALLRSPEAVERVSRCALLGDDRLFDLAIHRSGATIILEGQPSSGKEYGDVTGTVSGMLAALEGAANLPALLEAGARQLRALTGFDRVAVIRFADDGTGTIVAQAARAAIGPPLGGVIAFQPAARARYRRRRVHVIADTAAEPVALLSDPERNPDPIDLSRAMLRAPSPDRIAILRAHDVGAAMMLSLIVDGRLWGVIDCQHHFARAPGFERRSMADLFTQMFAMRIEICELKNASS